jgi:hypothetical protein
MYIQSIRIRNFMVHQDTTLSLSPLTVFVGANGGGKSAFFDALLNFSMLARGSLQQAFGPYPFSYNATLYRGASSVSRIGYSATMSKAQGDEQSLVYEIDYGQTASGDHIPRFVIFKETLIKQPGEVVLFDRSDPDHYPAIAALPLSADKSVFATLRQAQISGAQTEVDELFSYCTQQVSRFNKFRLGPSHRLPRGRSCRSSLLLGGDKVPSS